MSTKIILTFSSLDGRNSEKVEWIVRSTPLAERWISEMIYGLKKRSSIREQRFVGWLSNESTLQNLVDQLNESISVINEFFKSRYHIPELAHIGMHQDTLNALHHHFEILIGQSWNRAHWFQEASPHVSTAIRKLNDNIHDFEAATRVRYSKQNGLQIIRYFQFQIVPYRQKKLTERDLSDFTYASDMGDLVTNYCQLGKTWIEVYQDQDDQIHLENIAPLRYYSSSFNANFYENSLANSQAVTQQVKKFIQSKNLNPDDPRNALGHSVYASLPSNSFLFKCSDQDRVNFFSERLNISEVRIENGWQVVERKFSNPHSYFVHDPSQESQWTRLLGPLLNKLQKLRLFS